LAAGKDHPPGTRQPASPGVKGRRPEVFVLAGPNGAGKSTTAPGLLKGLLEIDDFVNADVIARGLSGFAPEAVALEAGAIMLQRLRALAESGKSFAFETTLASRTYAPWLRQMVMAGYQVHLVFLWLSSPDLAVQRVTQRVRMGGHGIPEATIRRRYEAGLRNFFRLYRPLATTWRLYDNSERGRPQLVAFGQDEHTLGVVDATIWERVQEAAR
jgi:predicted ABC-type ATPase